jgi:hypothetical protein
MSFGLHIYGGILMIFSVEDWQIEKDFKIFLKLKYFLNDIAIFVL